MKEAKDIRAIQRGMDVAIGVIRRLSEDGRAGIISQLDSGEEAIFLVDDVVPGTEEGAGPARLEGQLVQFVREQSETGQLMAKDVAVLGEGKGF